MPKCPNCGSDNPDYAFFCNKCSAELKDSAGKPFVTPNQPPPPTPRKVVPKVVEVELPTRSVNPVAGGVCLVLSGILAVVQGGSLVSGGTLEFLTGDDILSLEVWGGMFLVLGLATILLGLRTMRRIGYTGALVGVILGILGWGFGIGAVLALAGLVLIASSRREFS